MSAGRKLTFVEAADVETQRLPWGYLNWLSEPRVTGAERFSTGIATVTPGQGHERHNHPGTEEILYIIKGTGQQMVEVDGEPVTRGGRAGDLDSHRGGRLPLDTQYGGRRNDRLGGVFASWSRGLSADAARMHGRAAAARTGRAVAAGCERRRTGLAQSDCRRRSWARSRSTSASAISRCASATARAAASASRWASAASRWARAPAKSGR